jgi:RHS repeat-associated protein
VRGISDHEGSVTHLTSATGTVIEKYRYDAFGAPTFYNGSGTEIGGTAYFNSFLFTGRRMLTWDTYEYRARIYNMYLGRFMSEDPKLFVRDIGMGKSPDDWSFEKHPDEAELNLFRYCGNDPLDFTDPMGLEGEVLLIRDSANRTAPGTYIIKEDGVELMRTRANENGFFTKNQRTGQLYQGIKKGDYILLPKAEDGKIYKQGTPAITGSKPGLQPGQPNASYYPGSALVHEKGPSGEPDSRACVTVSREAADRTKEVMDRNLERGGTTFRIVEPKTDGHPRGFIGDDRPRENH